MNERIHDAEVTGFLAYTALATHGRIVKDAYMSPDTSQLLELLQISRDTLDAISGLESYCENSGYEMRQLLEPALGIYDQMEARLRPGNWAERLVKTYVVFGLIGDCVARIGEKSQLPVVRELDARAWPGRYESWARHVIKAYAASDEQMAQRLSLWGRRVFGEGLQMVLTLGERYPHLGAALDLGEASIVDFVQDCHGKRMSACGLTG